MFAPSRFLCEGSTLRRSTSVGCSAASEAISPMTTLYMLGRSGSRRKPRPLDAFDCGSQSTSSVGAWREARDAARLIAVVVLPTPPFWLVTAMTRAMSPIRRLDREAPWGKEGAAKGRRFSEEKLCNFHPKARKPLILKQVAKTGGCGKREENQVKLQIVPRGTISNPAREPGSIHEAGAAESLPSKSSPGGSDPPCKLFHVEQFRI